MHVNVLHKALCAAFASISAYNSTFSFPYFQIRHSFLLLLCLVLCAIVNANDQYGQNGNNEFSLSSKGPFTNVLRKVPGAAEIVSKMLEHQRKSARFSRCGAQDPNAVNIGEAKRKQIPDDWTVHAQNRANVLRMKRFQNSCASSRKFDQHDAFRIMHDTSTLNTVMKGAAKQLASSVLKNFTTPIVVYWHSYNESGHTCQVAGFTSVRRRASDRKWRWYINIGITDTEPTYDAPRWRRSAVSEYVHAFVDEKDGKAKFRRPANFTHFLRVVPRRPALDSTTSMSLWSGRMKPAQFYNAPTVANYAVRNAITSGKIQIDLARDAIAPSNAAILIVPIIMNFMPIAALAEVSTKLMILYIIFTDIFTAIPLLVMGAELIRLSTVRNVAAQTWLLGVNDINNNHVNGDAISESWVANCGASPEIQKWGIIFLTLALVSIVIGISLEFGAAWLLRRRKHLRFVQEKELAHHREAWYLSRGCARCGCTRPYVPAPDFAAAWEKDCDDSQGGSSESLKVKTCKRWPILGTLLQRGRRGNCTGRQRHQNDLISQPHTRNDAHSSTGSDNNRQRAQDTNLLGGIVHSAAQAI